MGIIASVQTSSSRTFLAWASALIFIALACKSGPVYSSHSPHQSIEANFRFKAIHNQELEKIGIQRAMVQDKQGFIWFGGENGLARFDSYEIKLYRHSDHNPQSLSNNNITDLHVDKHGQLWISTTFGLNKYNPSNDGFVHYFPEKGNRDSINSNSVMSITETATGLIALATFGGGLNIYNPNTQKFTHFIHNKHDKDSIAEDTILTLLTDHQGHIWLGTRSSGVDRFDPNTNTFTHYLTKTAGASGQSTWPEVYVLHEDSHHDIWVGTASTGLFKIDTQSNTLVNYMNEYKNPKSLADNAVWEVFEDAKGNLWVATDSALNLLDPNTNTFTHHTNLPDSNQSAKVRTIFQDKDDNLWFGLFPSGSALLNHDAMSFRNYYHAPHDPNSLSNSSITALAEDSQGNLWVGTEAGLNYLNRTTHTTTRFIHSPEDPSSIPSDAVISLFIDSHDTLWVGTWRAGWARFDPETNSFHRVKIAGQTNASRDEVWDIYEDKNNDLWVSGLYKYARDQDEFVHYDDLYPPLKRSSSSRVKDMLEDKQGGFWLATTSGLRQLNRDTGEITGFPHLDADPTSVSANYINCLIEDAKGTVWIGTHGGGIDQYDFDTQTFASFGAKAGLPDDSVTGILEDASGYLWMSTGHGLTQYEPDTKKIKIFNTSHGLASNMYIRKALLLTSKNEIVAGGTQGLSIFDPLTLEDNANVPPIVFTRLQVLNEDVSVYDADSPLSAPINYAKKITLKHSQPVFSIEYSALNFRVNSQNKYRYTLEGFDNQWNDVDNIRRVTYTNLNPGTYTFHVKGSNNSGLWNLEGASIVINILPPWWRTWWAYALYATLFCASIYLFIYLRVKLKIATNDRAVSARLKQLDIIKDAFLANTSHELRTPLNGIVGLTQSLIDGSAGSLSAQVQESLEAILSSGKRLSNLTNDILDFSKLRNHALQLSPSPVNIYSLVTSVVFLSKYLIGTKSLSIICDIAPSTPLVHADEQRVQQIVYNLIGNAIKFTESGKISIRSKVSGDNLEVSIEDTGIGIQEQDLDKIFNSFEQSSDPKGYSGTGLGLSVTKQLIELHGGCIKVVSRVGFGSTFSFTLPLSHEAEAVATSFRAVPILTPSKDLSEDPGAETAPSKTVAPKSNNDFTIMVVDDEPVNRLVMERYLAHQNYNCIECSNGDEALQALAAGTEVDLILLDVMMPGKSGYEVCKLIRESHPIHQLPILFLTANNRAEDLEKGYKVEGNDFLFKPIMKEELLAKINVHLKLLSVFRNLMAETD